MTRRLLLQALAGLTTVGASAWKLVGQRHNPTQINWFHWGYYDANPVKLWVGERFSVNAPNHSIIRFTVIGKDGMGALFLIPLDGNDSTVVYTATHPCSITDVHVA